MRQVENNIEGVEISRLPTPPTTTETYSVMPHDHSEKPDNKIENNVLPSGDLSPNARDSSTVPTLRDEEEAAAVVITDGKTEQDGGYGWVIAICAFFQNGVTWGMNSIFGVYLSFYLSNNYFPGATSLEFAFVGGLSSAVGLGIAPVANYLAKRWHYKLPMVIGTFFLSFGQIFAGLSTQIWQLFITQGIMFGIGLGFVFIPSLPILQQWFTKRRAFAMGVASMGSGFGALIFSTTTRIAIERHSLKFAFITNGLISLVTMIPLLILYKDRVKVLNAKFEPLQFSLLVRKPAFALVCLWGSLSIFGYYISVFTLSTFTVEGLGKSQSAGSTVTSILAAGQLVGRPLLGLLLDFGGRVNISSIATILAGFSCLFIWFFAKSYGLLIFFSFVQGFFGGMFWGAAGPISAEVVGMQDLASALSLLWICIAIPATFAQVISLELLDYSREHLHRTGTSAYHITIGFAGGAFVLAGCVAICVKFIHQKNSRIFQKT